MITRQTISAASGSRQQLLALKNELVVERMKLDKFFSIFLDSNEMEEDNVDTPEWITYREMLKSYERVGILINTVDYYIKHGK